MTYSFTNREMTRWTYVSAPDPFEATASLPGYVTVDDGFGNVTRWACLGDPYYLWYLHP